MMVSGGLPLLRCCLAMATLWAIAGCSTNAAVPAATSTARMTPAGGQPLPRLVVMDKPKGFIRSSTTGPTHFTVQALPQGTKVALSIDQVWARLAGIDQYLVGGSVAYLGMYTDEGTKATTTSYVTVGGPLSIPRCAGGSPSPEPRASTTPGGPPVGGDATACFRIFVLDATTGDVTAMFGADYPE